MIRTLAALALLTASAHTIAATSATDQATPKAAKPNASSKADPVLSPTSEWWEKVTVTLAGDGKSNSCRYETSLVPETSKDCDVSGDPKALGADAPQSKDQFTRLTFERRFNPGSMAPQDAALQTGDTLLGRQVLSLAIDAAGKVKGCRVIAKSGDMTPAYNCEDAQSEHFEASAAKPGAADAHEGFMTILVYGHEEHLV
ncbi:hypothetical protein [Sphingomonas sp. URHD0057]|uniref:hypothetical protein n=1 Tax=Sphingomonas sp. URHD0057 TaxID=1380389 RepID=UPI0012DBF349|nr:hypothetical protein [Sphingomonas sp. URHD0057]